MSNSKGGGRFFGLSAWLGWLSSSTFIFRLRIGTWLFSDMAPGHMIGLLRKNDGSLQWDCGAVVDGQVRPCGFDDLKPNAQAHRQARPEEKSDE